MKTELKTIAVYHGDFPSKFGVPRQSGLANTKGVLVFEPEYSAPEAFRDITQYSRLWLIWGFSLCEKGWSPTVRPPRLGGNRRIGVFATRSPFRPNPLGLSSARLISAEIKDGRMCLSLTGADLADSTPVYDVKPYLPYADSFPDENGGFAEQQKGYRLRVSVPDALCGALPTEKLSELKEVLSLDPRPSYQHDAERIYGFDFAGCTVRFRVDGEVLTVTEIAPNIKK